MIEISSDSGQDDLPDVLAIFPLASAVLLPRQVLPLNIFEPRYVSMVEDALRSGRHIGRIGDPKALPVTRGRCRVLGQHEN